MRYVKEKYPDAVLEHIPRHNAFGAVLQNDTILPLYYDAAGALQACTGVGNGLEKYGRTSNNHNNDSFDYQCCFITAIYQW